MSKNPFDSIFLVEDGESSICNKILIIYNKMKMNESNENYSQDSNNEDNLNNSNKKIERLRIK